MAQALKDREPEDRRPVAILSQDEGRFGCINQPRRCWAPKGRRPRVPRPMIREFVYIFAAACAQLGRLTALILPTANTEMMNLFLCQVAQDFQDYFVILVLDRAGWHRSKGLEVPENIRLVLLPPRSPELNPVEHLWEDLREKDIPNLAFEQSNDLVDHLCRGLTRLASNPDRLRSMIDFPYMRVTL